MNSHTGKAGRRVVSGLVGVGSAAAIVGTGIAALATGSAPHVALPESPGHSDVQTATLTSVPGPALPTPVPVIPGNQASLVGTSGNPFPSPSKAGVGFGSLGLTLPTSDGVLDGTPTVNLGLGYTAPNTLLGQPAGGSLSGMLNLPLPGLGSSSSGQGTPTLGSQLLGNQFQPAGSLQGGTFATLENPQGIPPASVSPADSPAYNPAAAPPNGLAALEQDAKGDYPAGLAFNNLEADTAGLSASAFAPPGSAFATLPGSTVFGSAPGNNPFAGFPGSLAAPAPGDPASDLSVLQSPGLGQALNFAPGATGSTDSFAPGELEQVATAVANASTAAPAGASAGTDAGSQAPGSGAATSDSQAPGPGTASSDSQAPGPGPASPDSAPGAPTVANIISVTMSTMDPTSGAIPTAYGPIGGGSS